LANINSLGQRERAKVHVETGVDLGARDDRRYAPLVAALKNLDA
jgi:hypothetical protein